MNRLFAAIPAPATGSAAMAQNDITALKDVDFVMQGGEVYSGQ